MFSPFKELDILETPGIAKISKKLKLAVSRNYYQYVPQEAVNSELSRMRGSYVPELEGLLLGWQELEIKPHRRVRLAPLLPKVSVKGFFTSFYSG